MCGVPCNTDIGVPQNANVCLADVKRKGLCDWIEMRDPLASVLLWKSAAVRCGPFSPVWRLKFPLLVLQAPKAFGKAPFSKVMSTWASALIRHPLFEYRSVETVCTASLRYVRSQTANLRRPPVSAGAPPSVSDVRSATDSKSSARSAAMAGAFTVG